MNIYVIMKRTFDTEEKIAIENGKIKRMERNLSSILMMNMRLKKRLQLRDEQGGEVTVVTVGEEEAEKELRTALAMGADKAVLIR